MWDYAGQVAAPNAVLSTSQLSLASAISSPFGKLLSNFPIADAAETEHWHCAVLGYASKGSASKALTALENGSFSSEPISSDSFAVVAWQKSGGKAFLATDRFASLPLCYQQTHSSLYFGSKPALLSQLTGESTLNNQALFDYAFFHVIPGPVSVYQGVEKIPPATVLTWDGNTTLQRYYEPQFVEQRAGKTEQKQLLTSLQSATKDAADTSSGKVAAFLSGGLDSSSVVGMLSRCSEQQAEAFTIGFEAKGYDEIPFARATAEHFGVKLHEHYLTPDEVLETIPLLAESFGEPFGNSSSVPGFVCARYAAEKGFTRLLAGDGGDELFAGNERYAKQKVFEPYSALPEFAKNGLLSIANAIPAALTPGPLSKPRSYLQKAALSTADRLYAYNFIALHGEQALFEADFLQHVDTEQPLKIARELFDRPEKASTLNRMLHLDWQLVLADTDLVKVGTTCRAAEIEVRYPMLNPGVVDLSCRISSRDKLPGNKLRDFYKQSCRGFLADSTLDKSKQGFGLPFGVWLREHAGLREIASDSLAALKKRGIYRAEFIDETQRLHQTGHAAYYGELVWIMMMLEQWFQHHHPSWSL